MKLNKIPKEELELLSYIEIAKLYLLETNKRKNTADLFREVCNLLGLSESEYVDNIADFFQSLTTSKEFILLEDGMWDLKSNHTIKVTIEDLEDENTNEEIDEEEETLLSGDEGNDLDAIDDTESFIDDDTDDELADLTIVDDEELEE